MIDQPNEREKINKLTTNDQRAVKLVGEINPMISERSSLNFINHCTLYFAGYLYAQDYSVFF